MAAAVVCAVNDNDLRGRVLEICGPEQLTMTQLAEAVQSAAGSGAAPRHLPRPLLRLLATVAGAASPVTARQNRAAVLMDTVELTGGARPLGALFPGQRSTCAADLLAHFPRT